MFIARKIQQVADIGFEPMLLHYERSALDQLGESARRMTANGQTVD